MLYFAYLLALLKFVSETEIGISNGAKRPTYFRVIYSTTIGVWAGTSISESWNINTTYLLILLVIFKATQIRLPQRFFSKYLIYQNAFPQMIESRLRFSNYFDVILKTCQRITKNSLTSIRYPIGSPKYVTENNP